MNDVFSFEAGGGMHYTEQKVVELISGKKLVWLVTHANLSFLKNPGEWASTQFGFSLEEGKKNTVVTFTHEGLVPEVECYDQCSMGWTGYLRQLEKRLN